MIRNLNNRQKLLLCASPVWVIVMIIIFPLLTYHFGNLRGFLAALFVYWFVLCLGFGLAMTGPENLANIYRRPAISNRHQYLNLALAIFPVFMVFFAVFLKDIAVFSLQVYALAALIALINGSLEELFWRGAFLQNFPKNWRLAVAFPWVLFTTWHIALALSYGVSYEGGATALIGGAGFLGLIWAFISWRSRSIFLSSLSHIAVNFFAFSGLIYANYF